MPIYEYRCESCGEELEKIQKVTDPALTDCPRCGKAALTKLISASGFRLKGSGWYETDFKTGNRRNVLNEGASSGSGASSGAKESASGEGKSSGGTGGKPDGKSSTGTAAG